jgi:hypothetical protein
MAITVTKPVAGADYAVSNKKARVRKLVFSGNYATGGEAFTASTVGLKTVEQVVIHGGLGISTDVATAIPVSFDYTNSKFVFYEGSAAGTALSEKTNAEAYPTGCTFRATFVGT